MRAALLDRFARWLSGTPPPGQPASASARNAAPPVDTVMLEAALRESLCVPKLVAEPWYVDRVSIDGPQLSVAGWSMPVDTIEPAGGLWIAWPKRTACVATDLREGIVRELGLAHGLVDNKVCAVDDTWSGLRFVFRLRDRPARNGRSR